MRHDMRRDMSDSLAEVFPAGDFLAEELEARSWTQAEFAEIIGRPAQFVSEIIAGKKEITRESATQFAAALGTSAEFWLNLQDRYHLWRQSHDDQVLELLEDVRLRARLKELAPVAVLRKRGFITGDTPKQQEAELKNIFEIDSIYDDPPILVAARRARPDDNISSTQGAWIACVRLRAKTIRTGAFSRDGLYDLARRLSRLVKSPEDFVRLPRLFAEVGVRLVYVEAFPSSRMDGCSFLLDDNSPVIGISGRGKRLDKVLFTLLHEVAHILLDHLKQRRYIIDDEELPTLGLEEPTNKLAAKLALPRPLPRLPERVSLGWVRAVSEEQGIHPIVLIGRLQNMRRIPWRTTLVKDAPSVTDQLGRW
jgi:HTH-type transcriptional regulator/antitoxin HigA